VRSAGWLAPAHASASRGLLKLDMHAQHLGTGLLRMHRWLRDLRSSVGNSTGASGILDETRRVCVLNGARRG